MPGTKNMLVGGLWLIGGLLVTALTYSASSGGGTYVVTYGAIIIGAVQFIGGLFQYVSYQSKGKEGKQAVQAEASARTILRAMMATAAADGEIEESELDSIASIYAQIFGSELDNDWIKDNVQEMLDNDFEIYSAITEEMSMLDPELIPLIFKASYFVAASDGSIDDSESVILTRISDALGMTDEDVNTALAQIQEIQEPEPETVA